MEAKWSTGFPIEIGTYWFYGRLFNSTDKQKWYFVEVYKAGNKLVYVTNGHFLYESEGAEGIWTKVEFPELPEEQ